MKRMLSMLLAGFLCLTFAGCGSKRTDALEQEVARLKEENNALTQQLALLQEQLSAVKNTSLERWELRGFGTDEHSGVTIQAEFWPLEHSEQQSAQLLVRLDGQETARADCAWDGECYRADLELAPADGYGYYCVLKTEDSREEIPLSTPESPVRPKLTYLAGSLAAYADAQASEIQVRDGTVEAKVTAVVQTPLLTPDGTPSAVVLARLGWYRGDTLLSEQILELTEGETEGSFTARTETSLLLPELSDGEQIDLILSAELTDGRVLAGVAGSWVCQDGDIQFSVG